MFGEKDPWSKEEMNETWRPIERSVIWKMRWRRVRQTARNIALPIAVALLFLAICVMITEFGQP